MPEKIKPMQLRKRIAPSIPLHLELEDESGDKLIRNFKLSLDFNAACYVQVKTGKSLLDGETWDTMTPESLSIIFYAAILANHPEYRTVDKDFNETDEGLEVVRSFMDASNARAIQDKLLDAFVRTLPPERQAAIEANRKKLAAEREKLEKAEREALERGEVPNAPAPANPATEVDATQLQQAAVTSAS